MRVVVTRIGPDGTMRRRMVDTAASGDVGPWEELIPRALAAPPPNRPGTRGPVYHLRAGERGVLVAGHDLSGPLYELVTAVPSAGRHLEPVTSQPAGALAAGLSRYGEDPGGACRKTICTPTLLGAASEVASQIGHSVAPTIRHVTSRLPV